MYEFPPEVLWLFTLFVLAGLLTLWTFEDPNPPAAIQPAAIPPIAPILPIPTFRLIPDQYKTYDELSSHLRHKGFENCDVVLAIDFTSSNREQGLKTFGKDLHYPHEAAQIVDNAPPPAYAAASELNPYQTVMSAMSAALQTLSPGRKIHVVGFGDTQTEDHGLFCLRKRAAGMMKESVITDLVTDCTPCIGIEEVLASYSAALPHITKSGPTSFVPILQAVSRKAASSGKFCFLFIIGDGAVSNKQRNADAVVAASGHPVSVSFVGVGDGPWGDMEEFDDELPSRAFDNWQTIIYAQKMRECDGNPLRFAVHSLMELPDQLAEIRRLGYLAR